MPCPGDERRVKEGASNIFIAIVSSQNDRGITAYYTIAAICAQAPLFG
jgi:hypothetical protein